MVAHVLAGPPSLYANQAFLAGWLEASSSMFSSLLQAGPSDQHRPTRRIQDTACLACSAGKNLTIYLLSK
jgi:hypothetical protein